ncbi:hypoxia-inducible factor 1-alpha-like isoform X1 [Argiope bruennichi]|uniref:hypoxia-inducible factor 1-alpha-like isoform X1 n=1 Tax=Argiope bruennichi TaxID=94029 RepID=UPI002495938F|nr:hypoxia-inducible factor 1-alpha-like isoform X1 [Argiope bruennichi]
MCGGKVAIPPIVKEKRRNSEKRKEKSRDAARCRRSKESEIFSDLSAQLPLAQGVASTLDKTSVMRLTVGYLKIRQMIQLLIPSKKEELSTIDSFSSSHLDGFILVLSEEGDVIYLSENVEQFIGISQVEMLGQSVYEFSHPCDHDEIKTILTAKVPLKEDGSTPEGDYFSIFVRMKSTIKTRGRAVNLKSATYQVIHYIGHKLGKPDWLDADKCPAFVVLIIGQPIPHPAHIDVPLDKDIFISRHSPDMKFTYIDEKVTDFLGYKSSELMGKSVYSFYHALDIKSLLSSFKTLFAKGQVETTYYRFLAKNGGHAWLLTQATLIYENGCTKPECVVCLNYVLSKIENQDDIVSEEQEVAAKVSCSEETKPGAVSLSTTCAIFTPKEPVMSKDFLNFPDTDILLFQEPLKDSKLQLELGLFPDDPCSIESGICDDPFSYRDDSLSSPSYCGTPESSLHLRGSNSTSPNTPDSGSLSDIPSLDPIDEFSNLDLKFTMPPSDKDSDCYEEDLDFRAPFIPMQMDDDFPLISPSSSVMWGPQEPLSKKPSQDRLSEPEPQRTVHKQSNLPESSLKSSLAALLQSDLKKTLPNKQDKSNGMHRKETTLQKRWPHNSMDNNNRNNSLKQRNFTPSKGYNGGHGNGGQIIMLESIPIKKQPVKSTASQRRNGQAASNDRRSNSPPFGSHTATVKVHDRLIKVQVSVSELPTTPIEHKQPFPSPPDPPPKRSSPSRPGSTESPKRLKLDNGFSGSQSIPEDSVLKNLLVLGEDASRGYLNSGSNRYSENKYEPAVLSLPSSECDKSNLDSGLLTCGNELLDSFLKEMQYDPEQGDDLLSMLDQPLLRNVPTLV